MSEISERADNLITYYGKAMKACGGDWLEPNDESYTLEHRKALARFIATLEADNVALKSMVERLMDAGHKYWHLLLQYKDGTAERGEIDEEWDAIVAEYKQGKEQK